MDQQEVTADQVPETTPEQHANSVGRDEQNLGVENASGGMFEDHGQNDEGEDDAIGEQQQYGQEIDEEEEREEEEDAPTGPIQGGVYQHDDGEQVGNNESQNQIADDASTIDEDEELKMKIVLYYHTLFQGVLSQWFVLMQQHNYSRLTKEQYVDLNIKIQKSLILDFDEESARESAEQDWKIDMEREQQEKKQNKNVADGNLEKIQENKDEDDSSDEGFDSEDEKFMNKDEKERLHARREQKAVAKQRKAEDMDREGIDYERLTEFFFDLCLSWCQFLDIETFLFFINGVFLNITKGQHINVSTFKDISEIKVLSIEFINHLLAYRSICQERQSKGQTYGQWYAMNFGRTHVIVSNVEKNLQEAFKGSNENRILDIWMDLPPQIVNQFINAHFDKMDKEMIKMDQATKTTEKLAQSIQVMEQLKRLSMNKPSASQTHKQYITQQPPQFFRETTVPKKIPVQIFNDKPANQQLIEKRLVGQLGDRYEHAQLIEISRNSYLISNKVRLPVFGRRENLIERTKDSISKKGYLLMKDSEFLSSQRILGNQNLPIVQQSINHKYVLDPAHSIVLKSTDGGSLRGVVENMMAPPHLKQSLEINQSAKVEETLDSMDMVGVDAAQQMRQQKMSEQQMQAMQQQQQAKSNIEVKVVSSSGVKLAQQQQPFQGLLPPGQAQRIPLPQYQQMPYQMELGPGDQQVPQTEYQAQERGPSTQTLLDDNLVQQVYQSYVKLLASDKNAKVRDIMQKEPFISFVHQGMVNEQEIESAVFQKLYAEEESADIQQMIAQFYNKFDELHEQSLTTALAKSPNKVTIKNEVKYRIPERWTQPFHKSDIVSNDIYKGTSIPEERGRINKVGTLQQRQDNNDARDHSIAMQIQGNAPIQNPILQHSLSSKNVDQDLQSPQSMSSVKMKGSKVAETQDGGWPQSVQQQRQTPGPVKTDPLSKTFDLKQTSEHKPDEKRSDLVGYHGAESTTEAQSRGELDASPSRLEQAFGAQHLYDWSEVAYLFDKGEIPEELAAITDPIEYNYLLVRLRKEFNEKHKSNYLKYMNLQLPYHSRRDEVGGTITDEDWGNFVERLENIIKKVDRKRKRIIRRRKKRGKKKMPRKTLFKPEKRMNMAKDPLWREIFIDNDSDSSDESGDDEEELLKLYKEACEKHGVPVNKEKLAGNQKQRVMKSAKVEMANREKDHNVVLPPIKHPSMHPNEKPHGSHLEEIHFEKMQKKREIISKKHRQKTGAGNMQAVLSEYPNAKDMINIHLGSDYLPDPFEKRVNQAARVINKNTEVIKKVEHTYTDAVKKQIARTKTQGQQAVERKSMVTEIGNFARKTKGMGFLFSDDAHMVDDKVFKVPAYSTAQKDMIGGSDTYQSSEHGKQGKIYKFKNIHGDRGTYDGLSSQVQDAVPSSIWRDHPIIPEHLQEIPGGHKR